MFDLSSDGFIFTYFRSAIVKKYASVYAFNHFAFYLAEGCST